MKRITLFAMLLVFASSIFAQDIITLKTGDEINAKVVEVGSTEIKYKKWNNQDGPTYVMNVSDVFSVKYQNGEKDVFNAVAAQNNVNQDYNQSVVRQDNPNRGGRMEVISGDLYVNGARLNESALVDLCGYEGLETYNKAIATRTVGSALAITGWCCLASGFVDWLLIDMVSGYIVMGTSVLMIPTGYIIKGSGNRKIKKFANDYNRRNMLSDNFSISIAPTLMPTNTLDGNMQMCMGAGISLNF